MRVLVVDISHRFWSVALGGGLRNSDGAKSIVLREIHGLSSNYDRIVVAADGAGKRGTLFRARLWPSYKSDRGERAEHLWSLLADTITNAACAGWHVLTAPEGPDGYYEADDVIATVVAWCEGHHHSVDILTGDSDLAQLVSDDTCVRMLRAYKGIAELDENGVRGWLGVPPCGVVGLKALAGDAGDGYGSTFPGLGKKTAIAMLEAAGYSASAAIQATISNPKDTALVRTVRELGIQRLELAMKLARVIRDVPVDVDSIAEVKECTAPPDTFMNWIEAEPDDGPPTAPPERPSAPLVHVKEDPSMRMLVPAAEAYNRMVELQAFVRKCMVQSPTGDYGTIPGCPRPVLFKAGAEKLAEIYGLAPEFIVEHSIEQWDEPALFYYRVRCRLFTKAIDGSRVLVAECVGSANSRETKWGGRWVKERDVPQHLDVTRLKQRTFTARKGPDAGDEIVQYRIPNEDIFDQVNTILKMAQKRAMVGAVILATRSGGIFTQDLDDVPEAAYGKAAASPQWDV